MDNSLTDIVKKSWMFNLLPVKTVVKHQGLPDDIITHVLSDDDRIVEYLLSEPLTSELHSVMYRSCLFKAFEKRTIYKEYLSAKSDNEAYDKFLLFMAVSAMELLTDEQFIKFCDLNANTHRIPGFRCDDGRVNIIPTFFRDYPDLRIAMLRRYLDAYGFVEQLKIFEEIVSLKDSSPEELIKLIDVSTNRYDYSRSRMTESLINLRCRADLTECFDVLMHSIENRLFSLKIDDVLINLRALDANRQLICISAVIRRHKHDNMLLSNRNEFEKFVELIMTSKIEDGQKLRAARKLVKIAMDREGSQEVIDILSGERNFSNNCRLINRIVDKYMSASQSTTVVRLMRSINLRKFSKSFSIEVAKSDVVLHLSSKKTSDISATMSNITRNMSWPHSYVDPTLLPPDVRMKIDFITRYMLRAIPILSQSSHGIITTDEAISKLFCPGDIEYLEYNHFEPVEKIIKQGNHVPCTSGGGFELYFTDRNPNIWDRSEDDQVMHIKDMMINYFWNTPKSAKYEYICKRSQSSGKMSELVNRRPDIVIDCFEHFFDCRDVTDAKYDYPITAICQLHISKDTKKKIILSTIHGAAILNRISQFEWSDAEYEILKAKLDLRPDDHDRIVKYAEIFVTSGYRILSQIREIMSSETDTHLPHRMAEDMYKAARDIQHAYRLGLISEEDYGLFKISVTMQ